MFARGWGGEKVENPFVENRASNVRFINVQFFRNVEFQRNRSVIYQAIQWGGWTVARWETKKQAGGNSLGPSFDN